MLSEHIGIEVEYYLSNCLYGDVHQLLNRIYVREDESACNERYADHHGHRGEDEAQLVSEDRLERDADHDVTSRTASSGR